jgi:hypothetical protein
MPNKAALKTPESYFPEIEEMYGRTIAQWMEVLCAVGTPRHMKIIDHLRFTHGLAPVHANALAVHFRALTHRPTARQSDAVD